MDMKLKRYRSILSSCLMMAALIGTVSAAGTSTEGYTQNVIDGAEVTCQNGKYTASYSEVVDGEQYALLVVESDGRSDNGQYAYSVNENTIMYINQAEAYNGVVEFSFIPK